MTKLNCTDIRNAIAARDFIGWQGIPPSCSAKDLFDNIPDDLSGRPSRPLGDDFQASVFVLLELDGYYRPMASFRDNKLILFDGMNPELKDGFAPLYNDFGEPAARLDWHYGTLAIPNGEWIYPERGITVFLNTTADKVLHIALYQATNLREYQRALRPMLKKTLRPRRY